ncbi:MAG: MFS transporter [Candidatus Dormibacteraeota bacterium]|nr:MFS transporter [Candidatus Dormibacteraeota bacterium]
MTAQAVQPLTEAIPASRRGMRAIVVDRAFPALHHRNYRLFFSGQFISLIGTWTQQVAQGWLVWTISHSALMLGLVTGAQSLPILLFGLWGGAAADRMPKRRLLLATQVAAMALALALAALTFTGIVGPAHPTSSLVVVGLIAFGLGTVNAFDAPARQAFVIELVGKKHLLNAISLNSSIFNGARIVGPALAGLMIRFLGVPVCFAINGLSFLPVLVGLYLIRIHPQAVSARSRGSMVGNVKESLAYIRHEPLIRDTYLTVLTISVLVFSYAAMLPLFADQVLHSGAAGYSVLSVSGGAGALVAALSLAVVRERRRSRGTWIVLGSIVMSLAIAFFALSPVLLVSALMLALAGFSGIAFLARANTAIQTAVPDALRGRVMSVYILLLMGLAPIGAVQLGAVAHVFGAQRALAGESVLAAVILVALHTRRRAVRDHA